MESTPSPLEQLIKEAKARFDALTPEQQVEHRRLQRESYIRAELIENGVKVFPND